VVIGQRVSDGVRGSKRNRRNGKGAKKTSGVRENNVETKAKMQRRGTGEKTLKENLK